MALFNKLFQTKKTAKQENVSRDTLLEDDVVPFAFDKTQVRVLLFRECDRKGRKLLYDSENKKLHETIINNSNKSKEKTNSNCNGETQKEEAIGVQCKLTNSDSLLLGEMVFGSVAMNFKGMSLKIHVLKSPQRLMCTKVYCNTVRQAYTPNDTFVSSQTVLDGDMNSSTKLSPWPSLHTNMQNSSATIKDDHLAVNYFISKNDSGYSSQPSSHSSIGCQGSSYELWSRNEEYFPLNLFSLDNTACDKNISSSSSIQWRLSRHFSSTLDNVQSIFHNIPAKRKDSEVSRSSVSSSISDNMDGSSRSSQSQRIKMGIAIVITLSEKSSSRMLSFLMDHAILMEGALTRLKQAVHYALCKPPLFIDIMSTASRETAQWLVDLLSFPRISSPVWTYLSTCNKSLAKGRVADIFMNDFCSLLSSLDTKDTYFFMSTLLTNILTFHLGWVNSVSPYNTTQQKELDSINNYAPYNPLWAQLGELYGVIGIPSRVSRTIVYGKQNMCLIRKVLSVLTYFIRCVCVKRYDSEQMAVSWENVDSLINCYQLDNESCSFTDLTDNEAESSTCDIEMRTFSTNRIASCDSDESCIVESNLTLPQTNDQHSESDVTLCSSHSYNINNENIMLSSDQSTNSVNNMNSSEYKNMKGPMLSGVPNKMKKLSRLQTSGLLSSLVNDNSKSEFETTQFNNSKFSQLNNNVSQTECNISKREKSVIFILGEDEELIGLKDATTTLISVPETKQTESEISNKELVNGTKENSVSEDETSSSHLTNSWDDTQSKPCCARTSQCQHSSFKKHSGVKFDFEKYPQIVTNYMKSKNLQLLDRHVIGKPGNLKFVESEELGAENSVIDLPKECDACQNCSFSGQSLQTPSNASELEYTSDIPDHEFQYAKECLVTTTQTKCEETKVFVKKKLNNTTIVNSDVNKAATNSSKNDTDNFQQEEKTIVLPLNSISLTSKEPEQKSDNGYCNSLIGSVSDHYIPDLVLQGGFGGTKSDWEKSLHRDLKLQPGVTCLLADIDDWSVQVFGSGGGGAGDMSALVASMLDCIPQMCHAKVPPLQCLAFIESKLREMCIRSKGLAQLLIDKDFCDMEYLTKSLNLEPNDVPLLLAIASTHTPQATLKYGVSYR